MFFIFFLALALLPLSFGAPALRSRLAPIRRAAEVGGHSTNSKHIVAIKPGTLSATRDARLEFIAIAFGAAGLPFSQSTLIVNWSEDVFNGFAGQFPDPVIEALRLRNEVAWVQEDFEIAAAGTVHEREEIPADIVHQRSEPAEVFQKRDASTLHHQFTAPWGLGRLSSTSTAPFFGRQPSITNFEYIIDTNVTVSTAAFIIDTGCNETVKDLQGRAAFAAAFKGSEDSKDGRFEEDGHGTFMATVIGGNQFGVVKDALLNCIKITNPRVPFTLPKADTSNLISALNFTVGEIRGFSNSTPSTPIIPSVIVVPWASPVNMALDLAVSNTIKLGLPVIVAAGNDAKNVDDVSPARVPGAITVGATTINDTFASFSNFGSKVTILAPGQAIGGLTFNGGGTLRDGTSFAAAYVAGIALIIMREERKQLNNTELTERLTGFAATGAITGTPVGTTSDLALSPIVKLLRETRV